MLIVPTEIGRVLLLIRAPEKLHRILTRSGLQTFG